MAINKTVTIRGTKYRMYVSSTNWIFVKSGKTGRGYEIGKLLEDGTIYVEPNDALRYVSNEELAEAWMKN